jgi:hypothetical protein
LLITFLVLVVTLTALGPANPQTTDIVAIIGSITGVIGTLTAAFFGIQAAGLDVRKPSRPSAIISKLKRVSTHPASLSRLMGRTPVARAYRSPETDLREQAGRISV